MEPMVSLAGEAGTGDEWLEGAGCQCSRNFYSRVGRVGGVVEGEARNRSEM